VPLPSRQPSGLPAKSSAAAPVGERRYTEEELALILNRAAERQEGGAAGAPRYTLAEIQEIAAGAGISPDHVASVAASLHGDRALRGDGLLGAPTRFRFEETIDGEVTDDVVGELLDLVRRDLGIQGSVAEALGTVDWKGADSMGTTDVSIARRGGRTIISVLTGRTDAAGATATFSGFGALGLSALGMSLVGVAGLVGPAVPLIGVLGGGSTAWLAMRAIWRRVARRATERTGALGTVLAAAARRAVEDGRVSAR
jgi:hypothetical protein